MLIPLAIIIIVVWYANSWYSSAITAPVNADDDSKISFIVEKGSVLAAVAIDLKEKGLITNEDVFKIYTRLGGFDRKIVAGRFVLSPSMAIPEIVDTLTDTTLSEVVLTVPEGSTVAEIDNRLVELALIEDGEFEKSVQNFDDYETYPSLDKENLRTLAYPLEGYLFPDTYFLPAQDFHPENLIQLMIKNFEQKIENVAWNKEEHSLYEIVIMASILEKEVNTSADMPIVSGILWKRLASGWVLGADATLLYLKDDRTIDYEDLQEESDYNTRKNGGLPPGPIGNPGLETLKAATTPEESPYWFYLTTLDTGEVIYSVSNEEHNANKAKYLY